MGFLVLGRKERERVQLVWRGVTVWVSVLEIERGRVRLAIEAPDEVAVTREELLPEAPAADTNGR